MAFLNVRRLAAVDMHGLHGGRRRRQVIRVEFLLGAVVCLVLGVLSIAFYEGWGLVLGVWLIGVGANYVPLTISAWSLSRPGALEAELDGVDLRAEGRQTGLRQFWILVPFALVISAVAN